MTQTELITRGFTVVRQALSAATTDAMLERLEVLYETDDGARRRQSGLGDALSIENLINKGAEFEMYFLAEPVLTLAEAILGSDCTLQEAWSYGLPPGHADATGGLLEKIGNFHVDDPMLLEVPLTVIAVFAVVDFTARNGATEVVPGSHRWRRPPRGGERPPAEVVEMAAGDCLVMLGSTWHRAGRNLDDRLRSSVGAIYGRPWLKPILDMTRALDPAVVRRASPTAKRLLGFEWRAPFAERWQWDRSAGVPTEEGRVALAWDGRFGACCLGEEP